ncbi:MAG TPA: hypothetical protein VD866_00155 [Urbifossiella sp.]|nr:hypothetical protein [Urbifossiella sp.]
MTTLDEAWAWYAATGEGAKRLAHLATHWDALPWESEDGWVRALSRDAALGWIGGRELGAGAEVIRAELADLAVLVLFSVFEANVRDWVEARVRPEASRITEPMLQHAAQGLLEVIEHGSFGRLLEPYKSAATADLIEQVNQVRRYRNWVAHGRRASKNPGARVEPRQAYERLREFLALLRSLDAPVSPVGGTRA